MSGSAGSSSQSSGQQSGPWEGTQPYLRDIYSQAQQQYYGGDDQFFPGQTYANFDPAQLQANYLQNYRAQAGSPQERQLGDTLSQQMDPMSISQSRQFAQGAQSPYMQNLQQYMSPGSMQDYRGQFDPAARDQLSATAGGDYLTNNPYLDEQFNRASQQVGQQFRDITEPGIASAFGSAGRTGSGLQQQQLGVAQGELARELGGMATDIYGQNYQQERARQLAAAGQLGQLDLGQAGLYGDVQARGLGATEFGAQQELGTSALGADIYGSERERALRAGGMVPGLSDLQYGNIDRLREVGGIQQGQNQRGINEAMDRYYFQQDAPAAALSRYASLIEGLQQQSSMGRSAGSSKSGSAGAIP